MRKQFLNLIVSALILALAISAIVILPVTSEDTGIIVDKLNELNSKLNGENPALQNKVNAVIHQMESGAFNGALNKLQNDVKKSIIAWVADPEELLKLVDEIINLIKGITPPSPDFTIAASPTALTIEQGHSNASVFKVTSINGFDKAVDLSISSAIIPGVNATLNPSTVTLTPDSSTISMLILDIASNAATGAYNVTATGTSGALQHSVNITLTITAPPIPPVPDFSVNASPTTLTIEQGDEANSTIIVTSLKGFNESVELTYEPGTISGVTLSLNPTQLTLSPASFGTALLKIEVDIGTFRQELEITVTGASGALQRSVIISLSIIAEKKPPKIVSVLAIPETPAYNETVIVSANVVDLESGVKDVTLEYSKDTTQESLAMTLSGGMYWATIPAFPSGATVEYWIQASDNAGNSAESDSTTYIVADPYPPSMGVPTWSPQDPIANDDIIVNVTVTEPDDASGIDKVTLRYSNTTSVYFIPMKDNHDGNWTAVISNQTGPKVTFVITAVDKAGNTIESDIQEINITTSAFPLVWILAAIAILAAATGGGAYYVSRKRKKGATAATVPSAAITPLRPRQL